MNTYNSVDNLFLGGELEVLDLGMRCGETDDWSIEDGTSHGSAYHGV